MTISEVPLSLFSVLAAAVLSASLTWSIRPILLRHLLAKPNARSSHRIPTPEGAGVAVIAATLLVAATILACAGRDELKASVEVLGAALFLTAVGLADDIKSIPILPRLALQAIAVGLVVLTQACDVRIVPACPIWIERGALLFIGLWFVNLVNFMDGLDWMTVAEVVPITGALTVLGMMEQLSAPATIIAAALGGAMVGFAPFNRPVAKVFLGDAGSLPIGLLLGWCLLQLIYHHHFAAALLLPLYYLSDATGTLLRRLAQRETLWAAHRSHYYQRAIDNGYTVWRVVTEVFVLNIALSVLAILSAIGQSSVTNILFPALGCVAVAFVLYRFSGQRRP